MVQSLRNLLVLAVMTHLAVGCCWFDSLGGGGGAEWSTAAPRSFPGSPAKSWPEQSDEEPLHECVVAVPAGFGTSAAPADDWDGTVADSAVAAGSGVTPAFFAGSPPSGASPQGGALRLHLLKRVLLV